MNDLVQDEFGLSRCSALEILFFNSVSCFTLNKKPGGISAGSDATSVDSAATAGVLKKQRLHLLTCSAH